MHLPRSFLPRLAVLLAGMTALGCGIAPSLPPGSARGVGAGETRVDAFVLPALGGTVTRGVTERLDVSASVELVNNVSLGAKYTLVDRPNFAAAVEGRGFIGFGDNSADARGVGLGPVIELGSNPVQLIAGARWNLLEHGTYDYDEDAYVAWSDVRPRRGDDYGSIVQAYAVATFDLSSRGRLRFGATCDFYTALEPRTGENGFRPERHNCYPVVGLDVRLGRSGAAGASRGLLGRDIGRYTDQDSGRAMPGRDG